MRVSKSPGFAYLWPSNRLSLELPGYWPPRTAMEQKGQKESGRSLELWLLICPLSPRRGKGRPHEEEMSWRFTFYCLSRGPDSCITHWNCPRRHWGAVGEEMTLKGDKKRGQEDVTQDNCWWNIYIPSGGIGGWWPTRRIHYLKGEKITILFSRGHLLYGQIIEN